MNKQDEKRVLEAIAGLCELKDKKFSKAIGEIYLNALAEYPGDEILKAINQCVKTNKWFPQPSEIIQAIEGDPEERALNAWDTLFSAIRNHGRYGKIIFQDSKIGRLVQTFGGWDAVCSWTNNEVDFRRIEFVRSYKGMGNGKGALEISGAYSCGPLVMIGKEDKGDRNILIEYDALEGVH